MIIANPLYDTIFKHLMEDLHIAQGFLSKILGRNIRSLRFYDREQSRYIPENASVRERIKLFRLDFVAEIDTPEGFQKVLIELQKSSEHDAPHRFRAYIGRAYCHEKESYERLLKEERRRSEQEQREPQPVAPPQILPVIPIVILGFKLDPGVPRSEDRLICHVTRRTVNPNAGHAVLDVRYQLAECLSHDLILIQIPYLPDEPRTDLELMLSIFEQRFLLADTWKKDYPHQVPPGHSLQPLLHDMLHKLHLITEDLEVVEQLKAEEEGELFYTNLMAAMEVKNQALQQKDQALQQKDQALQQKDQALQQKDQALQKTIHEKDQALYEKAQLLQHALNLLMAQGMSETQAKAALGMGE